MVYIALWRVWISLNFYCMYYWMNFILSCERNTAYGQHFHLAFLFLTGYFHIVLSPRGAAVVWLTFLPFPTKSLSAKSSRSQGISPKEEEFIGFLCHISSGPWFLWSYRLQRPANYFSSAPKPAQVNYGCQEEHEPGFKHSEVIRVGPDNYLLPF